MTSSDDKIQDGVRLARAMIENFETMHWKDAYMFEALLHQTFAYDGRADGCDMLPTLIVKSASSRIVFRSLQRIAANQIYHGTEMRAELREWVCKVLRHELQEPTSGRTGPNKALFEQIYFWLLMQKIKNQTRLPMWPRETQVPNGNACAIIALASADLKKASGKSRFPTTAGAVEKRYVRALKIIRKSISLNS